MKIGCEETRSDSWSLKDSLLYGDTWMILKDNFIFGVDFFKDVTISVVEFDLFWVVCSFPEILE